MSGARDFMRLSALLALLFLTGGTGHAYIRGIYDGNEIKWRPMPNPLTYHIWNGRPAAAPAAFTAAADHWNAERRSSWAIANGTETGTNATQRDYENVVCWGTLPSGVLARNTYWLLGDGTIVESDIQFNTNESWSYAGVPQPWQFDFNAVATHELGHCLNIRDLYQTPDQSKTMFWAMGPGDTNSRSLEQDDKDGVAYHYPIGADDYVWIRDGNDVVDDGGVPYLGNRFWLSPDIALSPDPPQVNQSTMVTVTARCLRPAHTAATVIIEAHDPDVSLLARRNVLWADTIHGIVPPGNEDYDLNGTADYTNPNGDGETTFTFWWTPGANRFGAAHYSLVATVEGEYDSLRNPNSPYDNDVAQRSLMLTENGVPGQAETLSIEAGNPTGIQVTRYLSLSFAAADSGWTAALVGTNPQVLTPADTFAAVKVVVTPASGALPGRYNTVQLSAAFIRYGATDTLLKGGLSWRHSVAQPGDVGCTRIIRPVGSVNQYSVVYPACSLHNFGSSTVSYYARFRIGAAYDRSYYVADHAPATGRYVPFPAWSATPPGSYTVTCSTQLAGETNPANDRSASSLTVVPVVTLGWSRQADVPGGASGKWPKDGGGLAALPDTGQPEATALYSTKGNGTTEFYRYSPTGNTWQTCTDLPLYNALGRKKPVKKGASLAQAGGFVYANKGNGTAEFYRYSPTLNTWIPVLSLPGAAVKQGAGAAGVVVADTACVYLLKGTNTFEFYRYNTVANTWQTMTPAPAGLSGKAFKDGSRICLDPSANVIYALKGSYNEFFGYDIAGNTWTTRTALPLFGSSGKKKKAKSGASLAYLNQKVYVLKGGNTGEFWRYDPGTNAWTQKEDVPLGGGRNVKAGAALAAANGVLYALKGNSTPEVWMYTPGVSSSEPPTDFASCAQSPAAHSPLLRVTPSPTRNRTQVFYSVLSPGPVSVALYDVTGKLRARLASGRRPSGTYASAMDLSRFANGLYVVRLQTAGVSAACPLVKN
jgi:hypothetical protein